VFSFLPYTRPPPLSSWLYCLSNSAPPVPPLLAFLIILPTVCHHLPPAFRTWSHETIIFFSHHKIVEDDLFRSHCAAPLRYSKNQFTARVRVPSYEVFPFVLGLFPSSLLPQFGTSGSNVCYVPAFSFFEKQPGRISVLISPLSHL